MTYRYVRLIGTFFQLSIENMPKRNTVTVILLRELVFITIVIWIIFAHNIIIDDYNDTLVNTIPLISMNFGYKSSGIWWCVTGWAVPDVSKDCKALKKSRTTHPTTQHNIPEDSNPQQYHCENLKSQIIELF